MASYEIEQYLVATFDKGVAGRDKSKVARVHTGKLATLNDLLKMLCRSQSNAFFGKKNTRGYLYDLKNSLDECLRLSRRWFPWLIVLHPTDLGTYSSVGSSLKELKKKLLDEYKDLLPTPESLQDPDASHESTAPPRPADHAAVADASQESTTRKDPDVDEKKVHGFMEELVAVERLVVPGHQDGFKAVGIAGNAGVGKTTLCAKLLKGQGVRDIYVPRIYVHLPDKTEQVVDEEEEEKKSKEEKERDKLLREEKEKEAVLVEILGKLGVEKTMIEEIRKAHNVDGLASAVYAQLMGKRYLIVLDNVTSDAKWYNDLAAKKKPNDPKWGKLLAYALPKGYGGTILVTSRRLRLVNNMVKVDANVHRLVPRADKDFVLKIFKDSIHNQDLKVDRDVEKEIIKKCAGFPLAAQMMGEIMQKIPALKELITVEPPPTEAPTESTTTEGPPPIVSTENKTTKRESPEGSVPEILEEEEQQGEEKTKGSQEEEDEEVDGTPPPDSE